MILFAASNKSGIESLSMGYILVVCYISCLALFTYMWCYAMILVSSIYEDENEKAVVSTWLAFGNAMFPLIGSIIVTIVIYTYHPYDV